MALTQYQNLLARVQAMPLGRGKLELLNILTNIIDAQLPFASVATADDGTSQTMTVAMVTGGAITFHTTTGGATPSLTLPLAAGVIAALPGLQIGESFMLRIINANSGVATVVTNTGWTTSGTLTIANGTWRDFIVAKTSPTTLTLTNAGTGTNS